MKDAGRTVQEKILIILWRDFGAFSRAFKATPSKSPAHAAKSPHP
jgi:hypothetical protein